MELFWGDLHCHCGISYGFGSLENALEISKKHLDFCCITGHAMWPDMFQRNEETKTIVDFHNKGFEKLKTNWENIRKTVNKYNTDSLVTFQSYEMHSSAYGDHHFVSPDDNFPLIYRENPWQLVDDCGCRAIAVPHHIGYVPGYRGIYWDKFDSNYSPLVEVYSKHGCSLSDNYVFPYYHDMGPLDPRETVQEGLKKGKRFSFTGSTDHHADFPGSYGDGLTGVWAKGKNREDIWQALLNGHTYAVTGDRIKCSFGLNGAVMGDVISADKRLVSLSAEGDAPIEFACIKKNGRVVSCVMPSRSNSNDSRSRYKLRLEMGWGNSLELFHWEGLLALQGGKLIRVQPYWRGRNALSPSDKDADNQDSTNALKNTVEYNDESARFNCDTVCNKSTLHPQTSSFVFDVEGDTETKIHLEINGFKHDVTLGGLLESGFANQVKPWHSQAYKMFSAVPADDCRIDLEYSDVREKDTDIYRAEIVQSNGCRAFVSPIFVQ